MHFEQSEIITKALVQTIEDIQIPDCPKLDQFLHTHNVKELLDEMTLDTFWDIITDIMPKPHLYYEIKSEDKLVKMVADALALFRNLFINGIKNGNLIELAPLLFVSRSHNIPLRSIPQMTSLKNIELESMWKVLDNYEIKINSFGYSHTSIENPDEYLEKMWISHEYSSIDHTLDGLADHCYFSSNCSLLNYFRLAWAVDPSRVTEMLLYDTLAVKVCKMSYFDRLELMDMIRSDEFTDPALLFLAIHFLKNDNQRALYTKGQSNPEGNNDELTGVLEIAFKKIAAKRFDLFVYYDPIRFNDHAKHSYAWGCALAKIGDVQRKAYIDSIEFSEEVFQDEWMHRSRSEMLDAFRVNSDLNEYEEYCIYFSERWNLWIDKYCRKSDAILGGLLLTGYFIDVLKGYQCLLKSEDEAKSIIEDTLNTLDIDIHLWNNQLTNETLIYSKCIVKLILIAETMISNYWKLDRNTVAGKKLLGFLNDQRLWIRWRSIAADFSNDDNFEKPRQLYKIEQAIFGEIAFSAKKKISEVEL